MPTSSRATAGHLAVIPARGGSKRLPRKNIADFFGKPIIAYTLDAARKAGVFDRILVSTEDAEIARIARRLGAEVDPRPAALGADDVSVTQVCVELLERLRRQGHDYQTLTVLYATAPLRTAADVRQTFALLERGRCDFAMAATLFDHPVHQALVENKEGYAVPVFSGLVTKRSSDVDRYLAGNGSTYSVFVDRFLAERRFYGQPLRLHVMPPERSVDIDTPGNLELARFHAARQGFGKKKKKVAANRRAPSKKKARKTKRPARRRA